MKSFNKTICALFLTISGVFASLFAVAMFQQYLLASFPIILRMILAILVHWIILIVPLIMMKFTKITLQDIGFEKENFAKQILIGIGLALAMSLVLTVIPILLGFKDFVAGNQFQSIWQFAFYFVYDIAAIGFVEEFIFRGCLYNLLLKVKDSLWFAILVSSILFGLYHIVNGLSIQMITTTFIGILFCICRQKIKNCTLLSLILMHGIYDWLILVWGSLL